MEENKKSGAFRKKKTYFTQVSNNALRDTELSLKAKGLYSLIQSYITIENFTLYKTTLLKLSKDKETAFDAAWKELKSMGYLVQYKSKGDKGKWIYEYDLLDSPGVENPGVDNPGVENPHGGETTPGKHGVFNKTNLNNTDLNNTKSNNTNSSSKDDDEMLGIMRSCQKVNLHLTKEDAELLKEAYGYESLLKAIVKTKNVKDIRNPYDLLATILENMERTTVIENKGKEKNLKFNNFEQRVYDYDDLERKLLGWDKDE